MALRDVLWYCGLFRPIALRDVLWPSLRSFARRVSFATSWFVSLFFFFFFPSPSVHLDAVRRRCATSVKPHIKVVVRVLHSTSYLFVFFKVTYDSAGGQLRVEGPEATDIAFDELLKWLNAYLPCFGVVSSPRKEDTAGSWRSANIAAAGGSGNTTFFFACTGLIVTLRVARTADGGFACVTRECWGEVSGEKAHAHRIRRKT